MKCYWLGISIIRIKQMPKVMSQVLDPPLKHAMLQQHFDNNIVDKSTIDLIKIY